MGSVAEALSSMGLDTSPFPGPDPRLPGRLVQHHHPTRTTVTTIIATLGKLHALPFTGDINRNSDAEVNLTRRVVALVGHFASRNRGMRKMPYKGGGERGIRTLGRLSPTAL